MFESTFLIRATLWHELGWSHYRLLMKVKNEEQRSSKDCL
jgi:hypothetical protein